ncbi:YlcG family protein [Pantoea sp. 1B4]|nr:YlcG family protein [Pantoea sp. 1B4]MBN1088109.1 YlcG family protein [Pantoea sp. 1B4]
MTEYLREKWQKLRIYKRRGGFAVDYRILRNMAKMMGVKHAH